MTTITRERLKPDDPVEADGDLTTDSSASFSQPASPRKCRDRHAPLEASSRSAAAPAAAVILLSLMSTAGFGSALNGWGFASSAVLGVFGASVIHVLARRADMLLGETIASSLVATAILGGPASGGLPAPESYRSFANGLIDGWADLLTSAPPADLNPSLRVLPYIVAWVGTATGLELSRRTVHPVAPLAGPALGLLVTTLLTIESQSIAVAQGLAFSTGALLLGTLAAPHRPSLRVLPLLMAVAVVAPLLAPRLPFATENERFDIRRLQDRPWNPLDTPSPLVTLKASLKEGRSSEVVFTVRSTEPITRWQSAVLGHYDGVVWSVANDNGDPSADFEPVDSVLPAPPNDIDRSNPVTYELEIGDLGTVWVPSAGWPTRTSDDLELDLRVNRSTGTLAAVGGLQPGQQIVMTSFQRPELSTSEFLAASAVSNDEEAELTLIPPAVRNTAGDVFEGVDAGTVRAVALSQTFTLTGFYDHGTASRPGHSLARIDEFLADPDRLVGYAETYAAAAGVVSRIGGVPSRVVVGYVIPEDRYVDGAAEVVAEDITAWIEIETVEHGWVPLDVTPDRTREPQNEQLGVSIKDVAVPNPPPPPPPPPESQPSSRPAMENDEDDGPTEDDPNVSSTPGLPRPVLVSGVALALPTLLLVSGGSVVVALKARCRRRRQASPAAVSRVAGAWRELLDRLGEAGFGHRPSATASETASDIARTGDLPSSAIADIEALAKEIDRATFHPTAVTEKSAQTAWEHADRAVAALAVDRSRWERLCLMTDPRPLLPWQMERPARRRQNATSKGHQ